MLVGAAAKLKDKKEGAQVLHVGGADLLAIRKKSNRLHLNVALN